MSNEPELNLPEDHPISKIERVSEGVIENAKIALRVAAHLVELRSLSLPGGESRPPGAETIDLALRHTLAMALARLFDGYSKDKKSIPTLVRMLEGPGLRAELIEWAGKCWRVRQLTEMITEDEVCLECQQAIDRAVATFKSLGGESGSKEALGLKGLRNHKLAHSLQKPRVPQPAYDQMSLLTYDQMHHLLAVAKQIADDAALAIRGKGPSLDDFEAHSKELAQKFWAAALRQA